MSTEKTSKTALDNDYDNESWLGKKEISFSTKLLAVAGGITSLGGLFPMFVDKLAAVSGSDGGVGQGLFALFAIGYFSLPIFAMVVWSWISDRIAYPDRSLKFLAGWNFAAWKQSPLTYRYMWLLLIQAVVTVLYLFGSIYVWPHMESFWLVFFSCTLLIVPGYGVATFSARNYAGRKLTTVRIWVAFVVAVALAGVYLYGSSKQHDHEVNEQDFKKLVEVDRVTKSLDSLENYISNKVDRFYIKSSVQAKVTLGNREKIDVKRDYKAFEIDRYLKMLDRLLLKDTSCCVLPVVAASSSEVESTAKDSIFVANTADALSTSSAETPKEDTLKAVYHDTHVLVEEGSSNKEVKHDYLFLKNHLWDSYFKHHDTQRTCPKCAS